MNLEDYAKDQLSSTYARIASDQETRSKIKTWCVTVWVGSIAAVSSNHVQSSPHINPLLPLLPIVVFWFLDAIYQVFIGAHCAHAKTLEKMLLGLIEMTPQTLLPISLESGEGRNKDRGMLLQVLYAFFAVATSVSFYFLLLAVTALFYWIAH